MSADALELALALRQAPIQRFTLRDRPLPENIGEALQLASAMQPQLETTAARFSESEEAIVEAIRFYLHQVLFEPGTDAYRVLGLKPDAEFNQIRQHHIWLQRWLHPDRRGEDWEAVLATKINWAWQQLRNESSREKYDQSRPSDVQPPADENANAIVVQTPAWSVAPVGKPQAHWLRRFAIGSLMVVCASLFYLAVTRQDRVDPDALASQAIDSSSAIRARVPFDTKPNRRELSAIVPVPESTSAPAPVVAEVAKPAQEMRVDHADTLASAVSQQDRTRIRAGGVASATEVSAEVSDLPARPARSDAHGSTARSDATSAIQVRPSSVVIGDADGTAKLPVLASAEQRKAEDVRLDSQRAPKRVASIEPKLTRAAAEPEALADQGSQRQPAMTPGSNAIHAEDVARTPPALAKTAKVVAVVPVPEPVARVDHSELIEAPSDVFDTAASASIEAPVEREIASLTEEPIEQTPDELSRETLARFELARQRVRGMIDYFRSQEIRTSGWDDDHGQHTVEHARSTLRARNGLANTENFALDPPTWRITNSRVSLQAAYHVDAKRETTESGQFTLKMAWRDGNWKITRIEVSPSR